MTGSTTNGQIIKYEYEAASLAAGITTLVAGMVVSATLEVMFMGDANIRAIDFRLTPVGAARNDPRIWIDFDSTFDIPANAERLVLDIPETEPLPAGTTGVRPQFYVTCGTLGAGTTRIAVRRLDIRSR